MRIFAFGCSLTQYFYSTWADILSQYRKTKVTKQQLGKSGAGNVYIAIVEFGKQTQYINLIKMILFFYKWTSMYRR